MKKLDFNTIGKRIKERRRYKGLTQEYVGNLLDVNASHISNIEAGRTHPSLTALVCIANILECSVDYFISGEYSFLHDPGHPDSASGDSLDMTILEKLSTFDSDKKRRAIKILDLL